MLEFYSPGKEIPKFILEANGRSSCGPLEHKITLTGVEQPWNTMIISRDLPREHEDSSEGISFILRPLLRLLE